MGQGPQALAGYGAEPRCGVRGGAPVRGVGCGVGGVW